MPERLQTLIHTWDFDEEARTGITFSGSIRLDPARHVVELRRDPDLGYPTTGTHYIIAPIFQPSAVRTWKLLQVGIQHKSLDDAIVTGDGYRLHDGTDQWWWDGAAWVVNTTSWNTEAQISANLEAFPATTRKLRLVIRLTTTDARATPTLSWARLAWTGRVNWMEDLLYRTLGPYMRNVTSVVDLVVKAPTPGSVTVGVQAALQASGLSLSVVDCNAVFNHATDPGRFTNLLDSWDQPALTATLTAAQPAGNNLIAELVVQPEVVVQATNQDYSEVEKVPALILTDVQDASSSPLGTSDGVVDKATGVSIEVTGAYRCDITFSMIAQAAGGVDLARMVQDLIAYVENNPIIRTSATDSPHRIWLMRENIPRTKPNNADVHSTQLTFTVKDVLAFNKAATTGMGVTAVQFGVDPS